MIIWSGWGFVSAVIFVVGVALGGLLGANGLAEGYAAGFGLLVAAVGNWFAGNWINDPSKAREMIDAKTGQRVIFRPRHTLFFVPMQWWSIPMLAGGLIFIGMQATGNYHPSPARHSGVSGVARPA